jgi:hypothetical protein
VSASAQRVSPGLWVLCAASLLVWTAFFPWTQREQQNRHKVERLLRKGQIPEAIEHLSARERADFPPHWDPPPRIGYGQSTPSLTDMLDAIANPSTAPWVVSLYLDKAIFYSDRFYPHMDTPLDIAAMNEKELARLVGNIESLPERGRELAASLRPQFE